MKDSKIRGYIMAGVGFLMILYNAVRYFLVEDTLPIVGILGLVFVVIGMNMVKKR